MGLNVNVWKNCVNVPFEPREYGSGSAITHNFEVYEIANQPIKTPLAYKGELIVDYESVGSYSVHREFKDAIIKLLGRQRSDYIETACELPFYQFIVNGSSNCYYANESKILFNDFYKYRELAQKTLDEYDFRLYLKWLNIFMVGSIENSIVEYC